MGCSTCAAKTGWSASKSSPRTRPRPQHKDTKTTKEEQNGSPRCRSMIRVDSASQLQATLDSPQAIVFVHFAWSGQSVQSMRVLEQLERTCESDVEFYRFD